MGPEKGEPNTGGGESEGRSPVWERDLQETCGLGAQEAATWKRSQRQRLQDISSQAAK